MNLCVKLLYVKFVCVCEVIVCECVCGRRREEEEEEAAGIQNQKQEPHTKMWGNRGSPSELRLVYCMENSINMDEKSDS